MDNRIHDINKVITNAIRVMEDSKVQIFEICESARQELLALEVELETVMKETGEVIEKADDLENQYRLARIRLTEVSRDFVKFNEQDIKNAYDKATQIQVEKMMYAEKEQQLKSRRDDLQKRVRNVDMSIERAQTIHSQINVVLEYLSGDLNQVTRILESAKNRQLIGLKIIMAQEEERKRMARDIHDGPAQSLANLVLRMEIAERMIVKQEFEMVQHELKDLKAQVRSGLEEIRKIIFNLRPMALDDLGLVPTLRKYVQDFEEKTRIRTKFETIGREIRLPSAMEAGIYRLVQEAFTNVIEHANATYVSLEMTYQAQLVKILVADNGIGFQAESSEYLAAHQGSHFGLIGMKERAELLEGRLEIESAKDQGTRVSIIIPVNAQERKE